MIIFWKKVGAFGGEVVLTAFLLKAEHDSTETPLNQGFPIEVLITVLN